MRSTPLNKVSKMLILAIETRQYCIVVTILQFAFFADILVQCVCITLHYIYDALHEKDIY